VGFKKGFRFICIVFILVGVAGCGYRQEKRAVERGKRILSQGDREIDDLVSVRGKLRRIIDLKIQAVDLLEDFNRLLGRKYLEAGSYHLAEEALLEAAYLKPGNPFIKKDLGECYYLLGQSVLEKTEQLKYFNFSKEYYQRALEINPELTEARYGFGLLLFFGLNDVLGAIEQMQMVLEYDENDVDAHFALGRFYYEIGELGKSLGEYIKITRILPGSSPRRKKAEENIIKINGELGVNG
jgi:tetratricopeptide (TPR) repeat protein